MQAEVLKFYDLYFSSSKFILMELFPFFRFHIMILLAKYLRSIKAKFLIFGILI